LNCLIFYYLRKVRCTFEKNKNKTKNLHVGACSPISFPSFTLLAIYCFLFSLPSSWLSTASCSLYLPPGYLLLPVLSTFLLAIYYFLFFLPRGNGGRIKIGISSSRGLHKPHHFCNSALHKELCWF
jgi:hypothetical protein